MARKFIRKVGETNPDDVAILERRRQVAALYIRGKTQAEIGAVFGVTGKTICIDLQAIRAEWLASSLQDFDARKSQELAKLDAIEEQAWAAWERSQKDAETAHTELTRGRVDGQGQALPDLSKASKTVKGQAGDPRFLERVGWCVEQRCKILGLNAPQKHEFTDLTPEQRRDKLAGVLAVLRDRAGAAAN